MPIEMKAVRPQEHRRTYHYPDGSKFSVEDVVSVGVSESGGHRIETASGLKFIPSKGWIAIELDVEEWSF